MDPIIRASSYLHAAISGQLLLAALAFQPVTLPPIDMVVVAWRMM